MTATDDSRRKAVELTMKLQALDDELDSWLAVSAEGAELKHHHTQVLRTAGELKPLVAQIRSGIFDTAVRDWREVEEQLLQLYRVWGFFREKFALRLVPWLRDYLVMADEYAWACYAPAQRAAVSAGAVEPDDVRQPPLVCLTNVSTPFSIRRGSSYARDVGGGELRDSPALPLLTQLPIPVVGVPWFQLRHLPEALIIGHEVGHHVLRDFGLAPAVRSLINKALADSDAAARQRWLGWLDETFADVYGALAAGNAYPLSLGDFLLVSDVNPATDAVDDYPPSAVRLALALGALHSSGCSIKDLSARFGPVLSQADEGQRAEAAAVAKALVTGRFANLGGPLTGVLDPQRPTKATVHAEHALAGWPFDLDDLDIRTLLAAAAYAFADDPEGYVAEKVTRLVLKAAGEIQQPDARYGEGPADGPTAESTAKLFKLLTVDTADASTAGGDG